MAKIPPQKVTNIVTYARFSPRKNGDNCDSVQVQFDVCRQYAARQEMIIEQEFSDPGISGDDENRPGLWSAIDALRPGMGLLVFKLDRLARSVYLSDLIERAVTRRRAVLISASGEGTWNDSNEDWLIRKILQAFAEYEKKVIAARTSVAMRRHQANGRRMTALSKLPYGYTFDPDDDRRMVEYEPEMAAVRRIDELVAEGLSYRKIADTLEREGFPTREQLLNKDDPAMGTKKSRWHHYEVSRILKRQYK
ncbi:MAG TPA: recombinase family protein [Anaerohalosphaeraceae bacterium]|nr:recombinase family protein [Anaerohalosphaeraceae bacterium]